MATYYLRVAFNVNGGHVQNESSNGAAASNFYYSAGLTSYTSYTASTSYKYFKGTGAVTGCATSGGTYATHYQRIASTTTYPNLVNVGTFNIVRNGYHIVNTSAYRTTATGGAVLNEDYSSSSTTNPATYAKLGGSTSANKTVTIYVNWTPNEYSVAFNANGGTGTMSTETGFKYGTAKALTSNSFTRTGYSFAGWSTTPDGEGRWEQVWVNSSSTSTGTASSTALRVHNQILYIYYSDAWHKWDGSDIVSATAPATYINGSNSYSSCSPTPTSARSNAVSYISVAGKTYCFESYTSENALGNLTYWKRLYRWNPGQSFSDGASITTLQSVPTNGDTITLYAQWMPEIYSIAYHLSSDGDGVGYWSSGALHPTLATFDYTFTISHPSDDWYDFHGWYITGMDSTTHTIGSNTYTSTSLSGVTATSFKNLRATSGTVDFYASWGRTFHFHSGIQEATSVDRDSDFYNSDDTGGYPEEWLTFPTGASISGWTFSGWRDDTLAQAKQYNSTDYNIESQSFTNNEFYAVYTRTLTLSFANGGGSGTGPTSLTATQYYNSAGNVSTVTFTLPSNTFTAPSGYSFADWGSSSTGAGASYTWTPAVSASTTQTLTARWKRTIYFKSGIEESTTTSITQYYGTTSITTHTPTAISGWSTLGWRDDTTAGMSEYAASSTVTYSGSATTFYAVYSRPISATFPANGGSGTAPTDYTATQEYNSSGDISLLNFLMPVNPFIRPGYIFNGWGPNNIPEYGSFIIDSPVDSTATSFTLPAQWMPRVYIKQSGTWTESVPQIKVSGTWKTPTAMYVKVNGTWKQIY